MNKTIIGLSALLLGTMSGTAPLFAQSGHGHGMMGHNMATMPGLRGENATAEESAEMAIMFRHFDTITREVENLPNGIRTVTRSSNRHVMDALVSHAVGMIDRVGAKDDPKVRIQSPTLDIFFRHGEDIVSEVEMTDDGLVVVQTTDNPDLIKALQVHAAEVTDMADRGMHAVHEMMMKQGRGH
ncbi:hypothetical protein Z946_1748 [Sulfitobacter noctilucicola]|uniref:DUF302 domain-containing protein n=1 Tax=Sulfitobacter noctilucicola TaxID=1342301 RepID=A0A7W6Q2Z8_9RHOB|nr:hypothetical protein [Sulfitobacter noctilucicola]KIN62885.1 hypothetical protein Z946_1748 [Sulfitobacter noctilucicola]MBB4172584.1 hypothetical protein [Sulfitobacter noctilucicola]